jgi:hypothetical protein
MLKENIGEVLGALSEREAKVLKMRFGLDGHDSMTLEEVGRYFNVTRSGKIAEDSRTECFIFGIFPADPYHKFINFPCLVGALHGKKGLYNLTFNTLLIGNSLCRRHTGGENPSRDKQANYREEAKPESEIHGVPPGLLFGYFAAVPKTLRFSGYSFQYQ